MGADAEANGRILGKFGVSEKNGNGVRLLDLCSEFKLTVTGTFFRHKDKHKQTWYQRGKELRAQLDHIIV